MNHHGSGKGVCISGGEWWESMKQWKWGTCDRMGGRVLAIIHAGRAGGTGEGNGEEPGYQLMGLLH